jgi:hypothetical membrane protein
MKKILTAGLIVTPASYCFALFAGAATYPGYDHMTRYASELGAADAPMPIIFNASIMAGGVFAILGAVGLFLTLRELTARSVWAFLASFALALWGVAMVMGGMFPMPNELHGGFGLGFAGPLVPLFTLLALWRLRNAVGMKLFLALIFVGSVVLLAIMMGVGGLVRLDNVGAWQRANSGVSIPWLAVLGAWLLLRLSRRSGEAGAVA